MTLFIHLPKLFNRQISYEISDVYIMALTFIVSFYATRLTRQVIEKKLSENSSQKETHVFNRRGGFDLALSDYFTNNNEIVEAILVCVNDDNNYQVLHPRIKKLIFMITGSNIQTESLIIAPQFIRFLAKISYSKPTVLARIGNLVVGTDNASRFKVRMPTSAAIAILGQITSCVCYAILLVLLTFNETGSGQCSNYFEQLPRTDEKVIDVVAEEDTGVIAIVADDQPKQVDIYIPDTTKPKVKNEETKTYTGEYRKSRKKAK